MVSKRHVKKRCQLKNAYDQRAFAEEVLHRRREVTGDLNMRVYECKTCHKFHIGHYEYERKYR